MKSKPKREILTVEIPTELKEALKQFAEERESTPSRETRKAIRKHIKK
jgi:predicted transcriptional regulator